MALTTRTRPPAERTGPIASRSPVKWWAALGAAVLAFQTYLSTAWIVSGDATRTPNGPTPIPGWHTAFLWGFGVLTWALYVFCIHRFIIRPWRRNRRLETDTLIALALFVSLWIHDPFVNYFQNWVTFTTVLPNWGNWAAHVPGIQAQDSNLLAVPFVVSATVYLYWALPVMMLSTALMRRAKQRWPSLGPARLLALCWSVNFTFDLLAEIAWVRTGYYVYPGAIKEFTLFHGHYYQVPVYGPMLAAMILTGWAWLRYRRDDRGLTFVERGVTQLTKTSDARRTGLRFLAIVGYMTLVMVVVYDVPMSFFGKYADPWPDDFRRRSYLTSGLCQPDFKLCPSLLPAEK